MKTFNHFPRVMIIIATDIIGGPGKGILQFLKHAEEEKFFYILCGYELSKMPLSKDEFVRKASQDGIQIFPLRQRYLLDPTLIFQAYRLIRKKQINLIQTHGYKSNILGCLLKIIYKVPWLAFSHGYTNENIKTAIYNKIDIFCYRFANRTVVVSEPLKKLLIKNKVNPNLITIIDNAVSIEDLSHRRDPATIRESLNLKKSDKIIGVIGRLSPEKGQIFFLKAFREVSTKMTNAQALLIGAGPEENNLISYCKSHGLEKRVRFTGHVSNIVDYYQILDIVVIPSHSEGLPNVLLEALAFGIPVIATKVGAIPNVLSRLPETLIEPGDEREMAAKIDQLLKDEKICLKLINLGKDILKNNYCPKKRARKLIDTYNVILNDIFER